MMCGHTPQLESMVAARTARKTEKQATEEQTSKIVSLEVGFFNPSLPAQLASSSAGKALT